VIAIAVVLLPGQFRGASISRGLPPSGDWLQVIKEAFGWRPEGMPGKLIPAKKPPGAYRPGGFLLESHIKALKLYS